MLKVDVKCPIRVTEFFITTTTVLVVVVTLTIFSLQNFDAITLLFLLKNNDKFIHQKSMGKNVTKKNEEFSSSKAYWGFDGPKKPFLFTSSLKNIKE